MAETNNRNRVFISYSHKDRKFLDELLTHLKPLERAGRVSHWSDLQIGPGSESLKDIGNALALSNVAVLLVTPNFLASEFIHEHELSPLLSDSREGGVQILWIPVRPSSYKETALANYQALTSPDKPLALMKAERDRAWVRICEEIKKASDQPIENETARPLSEQKNRSGAPPTVFVQIAKQLTRLEIEWTLNEKNVPGLFERASDILKRLHTTVVDLYAEIAGGQSLTAITLAKSALDQISYLENAQATLDFNLQGYWNEGHEIFDLLRRAQECVEKGI